MNSPEIWLLNPQINFQIRRQIFLILYLTAFSSGMLLFRSHSTYRFKSTSKSALPSSWESCSHEPTSNGRLLFPPLLVPRTHVTLEFGTLYGAHERYSGNSDWATDCIVDPNLSSAFRIFPIGHVGSLKFTSQ